MIEHSSRFKTWLVVFHDIIMIPIAWFLAYWLRFSVLGFNNQHLVFALQVLPIILVVQTIFNWYFGLYRGMWRFASIPDLARIIKAVVAGVIISAGIIFFVSRLQDVPRVIFPLFGFMLIALLSGPRLIYRYLKDRSQYRGKTKRALIVGAGAAAEALVRDLLRSPNHDYHPVAFVDDDPQKIGKEIHGIRVMGSCANIKKTIDRKNIDVAIIAIPSASANQMRQIVDYCRHANIEFQTVPGLSELASGSVTINTLREVAVSDLLGREQVTLDWKEINRSIKDKIVLVSGGGGSIGSEICRQVARLLPKELVVIEHSELNIYQLQSEMKASYPNLDFRYYLSSVADKLLMQKILSTVKPDIVFHAAAYKHVPILENQIYSAVRNNVIGTKNVAEAAIAAGVSKFVLISTDKAVRPGNVMGTTKRLAEIVCQHCNFKSKTQFITVRFGNVLGSSGSVVPLFKKQLEQGGPITVTHPEVTRFFMTIPEAVQLILQACVLGSGGEIFVLDMGEPIKISYLAEQMIRLSGKEPGVDIEIVYSGLRPGEKLHEELFYKDEDIVRTKHKKIFQAKSNIQGDEHNLEEIWTTLQRADEDELFAMLRNFVPEFISGGDKSII